MKKRIFIIVTTFLFGHIISVAQSSVQSSDTLKRQINLVESNLAGSVRTTDQKPWTIQERMAFYKVPGVTVAVIRNYKLAWAKGYGWADVAAKIPVTEKTLFQAASVSKSLNAVGVLKLVQEGKIDPDKDINYYLKSWKYPYDSVSKGNIINIKHLLSHTGGISVHGFGGYSVTDSLPTIVQVLNGTKPANSERIRSLTAPGAKFDYSGGGVTVSQLILTDITGQPYDTYMYKNVLKPMGMDNSSFTQQPAKNRAALLATAYSADGSEVKGKYHIYPEQGAAGLWTNPTDLSKYIIETQLAYEGKSARVLNQQTTKLRLTPYLTGGALGVFIDSLADGVYFQHSGGNEGFKCQYYGSLQGGNGVVVMINSDNAGIIGEIVNSVGKVYGFKGLNRSKVYTEVAVDAAVLQTYVGEYEMKPGFILTVTREGNKLFAQGTGQDKIGLFAEAQNKFFLKNIPVELEFIKNNKNEVITCRVFQGGVIDAKRIK
ncbi:serine hydrolase [Mucilaginibacter pallidiroseus]|uniref:Serine hydrolase n=1 Tax=Mucilaginibacter pallidiroseus TaxID=2599295 RepID=A0A563UH14_9SPHI|nr:serine hydrolase [Mucilaginibacter pallidiroseus]